MESPSRELKGVQVQVDKLLYQAAADNLPVGKPHAFIYFITIRNLSDRRITLLGRKWILEGDDGKTEVIEGEKIVGQTPVIAPGESFSYNSYHAVAGTTRVSGAFFGIDETQQPFAARVPAFTLQTPLIDS